MTSGCSSYNTKTADLEKLVDDIEYNLRKSITLRVLYIPMSVNVFAFASEIDRQLLVLDRSIIALPESLEKQHCFSLQQESFPTSCPQISVPHRLPQQRSREPQVGFVRKAYRPDSCGAVHH